MDLATLTAIRAELESELVARRFGKIFQLSKHDIAIDFRLSDSRYLFLSTEPRNPRAYLIRRKVRDLEKASGTPMPFSLILRKELSGAELTAIRQLEGERVLFFEFAATDELGVSSDFKLAAQLTGASANLFLLDAQSTIIDSMRQTRGDGQNIGEVYSPPKRTSAAGNAARRIVPHGGSKRLSEQLDSEDRARSEADALRSIVTSARAKLRQEISKREKLLRKLETDLVGHGDAEKWKRSGDLLLANTASAKRAGGAVFVTNYFDDAAPQIAIEVDENDSITEAAEKYFKRYTKARNARQEIEKRVLVISDELRNLTARQAELESVIESGDIDRIEELAGAKKQPANKGRAKRSENTTGTRSFRSSDGFEILVGKKAKDNDFLTFRIAKSLDTWMHAADYPGSHVVVRNPNRTEVPHRTLLEAAELAAFYSQGKSQPKAAVHYTQKKFVNKPKGAAAGLVSLASFKTLLVEPKVSVERKVD